jgi:hypothetical protein
MLANHKSYTTEVDIFSFGVVMHEVFSRQRPYINLEEARIIYGVPYDNLRPVYRGNVNQYYVTYPITIENLMFEALSLNHQSSKCIKN